MDLRPYLTDEELTEYVPGYLEEGAFSGEGTLEDIPHRKIRGAADAECDGLGKFAAATGRG